ncbi:tripartite tricarboxylate transporter substrate binding protein [Roseomonas sp. M0104]|uniref:Tripartite tricarboxylate transporter substrate binding protein n=2 Tax=Teichococcus coralli TaxID=2545983 RepID=A0A845B6E4_9PROT|nr:tripartite tricarboxylate transporter substrate binding protein [Pseudoroseomonas coralli]
MNEYRTTRRGVLAFGAAALAGATTHVTPAAAQAWPSRPITMVVPFPPGGTSDTMARLIASEVGKALGQTIVVENRAGANGNIGSAAVARSAADGYTLLLSGIGSHAINAGLYKSMPYDTVKDFTHITLIASGPNGIAVHPDFPARTLADLVALAKREPGKHSYASSGTGSSGNLAMELFKLKAGVAIEHIPYRGGAPAMTDVLGGQVPVLITNADALLPHVKDGRLRMLAVTSAERSALFPDTPTVVESGTPDVIAVSWTGLSAPAGLPAAMVARLQAETAKAVRGPLKEKLLANGLVPGGISAEAYASFVASETTRWKEVVEAAGIKPE